VQPVMATAAAKMTAVMILTGRIATSPWCSITLVVSGISLAGAGHGVASGGRRGDGETDSAQSRPSIRMTTPPQGLMASMPGGDIQARSRSSAIEAGGRTRRAPLSGGWFGGRSGDLLHRVRTAASTRG
jgi:hypothetical protein